MKIAVGSDHIVTDTKIEVADHLRDLGHEVIDVGTYGFKRTHYPIFGKRVGQLVASGEADQGVALCGTGVGIAIAANKIPGVRSALVRDKATAIYSKRELNANVISFGGKITGEHLINEIVDAFINEEYQETEENKKIIQKINKAEENIPKKDYDHLFDDLLSKWDKGYYHD